MYIKINAYTQMNSFLGVTYGHIPSFPFFISVNSRWICDCLYLQLRIPVLLCYFRVGLKWTFEWRQGRLEKKEEREREERNEVKIHKKKKVLKFSIICFGVVFMKDFRSRQHNTIKKFYFKTYMLSNDYLWSVLLFFPYDYLLGEKTPRNLSEKSELNEGKNRKNSEEGTLESMNQDSSWWSKYEKNV